MTGYRLQSADAVLRELARVRGVQVLKPICDSQWADQLLAYVPEARILWLFRDPVDVAGSMLRKWPRHMLEVVHRLHARDLDWLGWRAERLGPEQWARLDALWRPDLSESEAAATFWWLRNQWFFALGFDRDPRVRLLRYENLTADPHRELAHVFAHVRARFPHALAADYTREHVGKEPRVAWAPPIADACAELLQRFDACLGKVRR